MNILIPMAGLGSRFLGSKYKAPKYLIDICGKSMIERAMESFKTLDAKYHFVLRETSHTGEVVDILNSICDNPNIMIISELTDGPANTALLMSEYINNDQELIIANCDQIIFWDFAKFLHYCNYSVHDGVIVTYTTDTPKNSYARIDKLGNVLEVREKEVISNISLNGVHYWKKGSCFVRSSLEMIEAKDTAPNGEYYIGPSYNYMIKNNRKIGVYHIPNCQHNAVGVPDDLDLFLEKYSESL